MLNDLTIAVTILTCGVVFLMALWGCSMKCMKTKCCLIPFALLLLVLFFAFLAVGGLFVLQYFKGREYIESRCDLISQGQKDELLPFEKPLFDIITEFDIEVLGQVNSNMCSEACPCYQRDADFATYADYSEETLQQFGRT